MQKQITCTLCELYMTKDTAVFKKVAVFNIDFASRDGNRTQQNVFRVM